MHSFKDNIITIITLKTHGATKLISYSPALIHVSVLCGGNLKRCIYLHILLHHRGLVLCSLRSESISAKLFAPGHHHGKGVKAVCRPSSNTIGLPTSPTSRASNTKPIFTRSHMWNPHCGRLVSAFSGIIWVQNTSKVFFSEEKASEPCIPFISVV